jgi:hypothetical protein
MEARISGDRACAPDRRPLAEAAVIADISLSPAWD